MASLFNAAKMLLDPFLLSIVVIYVYGYIVRLVPNELMRRMIMGLIFGLSAVIAMVSPIIFSDGVIVDLRNLLVGLSGAFFGIPGAIIAGFLGLITRYYVGGGGMFAGMIGITISASVGLLWAFTVRRKLRSRTLEQLVLGLMISAHILAVFALPAGVRLPFFLEVGPVFVLFNFVGSILLGSLLNREEGLAAENEALFNAATTDPLTRLHNRRSAIAAYEKLPEQNKNYQGTAMLCFDVDNFKGVNDTNGHTFGDAVLTEITQRISNTLRPTDVFSRLGGDEFLIILPSVSHDETQLIAERCRAVVAQKAISFGDQIVPVTISVGAEWLPKRPDFLTFVTRADKALYQAKSLGRNCVAFTWQNATCAAQSLASAHAEQRLA